LPFTLSEAEGQANLRRRSGARIAVIMTMCGGRGKGFGNGECLGHSHAVFKKKKD